MTDMEALTAYAMQGDADAFRHLVLAYQRMAYSACWRVLGSVEDAEDAVQEAFLKLAKEAGRIEENPACWLYSCALNIARNKRRSEHARKAREMAWASDKKIDGSDDWRELMPVIDDCISDLPSDDRELLLQYYFRGDTQAHLAEERGITQPALKKRLDRTIDRLRRRLRGRGWTVPAPVVCAFLTGRGTEAAVPASLTESLCKMGLSGVGTSDAVIEGSPSPGQSALRPGDAASASEAGAVIPLSGKTKAAILLTACVLSGAGVVAYTIRARQRRSGSVNSSPSRPPVATDPPNGASVSASVTYQQYATLEGHPGGLFCLAFSPDSRTLVSSSWRNSIRVWDVASGQERQALTAPRGNIVCLAFSPDGRTLAMASEGHSIELWDTAIWQLQRLLPWQAPKCVAFSPDGEVLASGSWHKTVKIWDTSTWEDITVLAGHPQSAQVESIAFGPRGAFLAARCSNWYLDVWELSTKKLVSHLWASGKASACMASSMALSPDGEIVATGGYGNDNVAELCNWRSQERVLALKGHTDTILSLDFSPDGNTLATASRDGTAKLWDTRTGKERTTLRAHTGSVVAVAFSPDGQTLATAGGDHTAVLRGDRSVVLWRVVKAD